MSKTGLQVATAILGLIPIVTGIIGLFGLADPLYPILLVGLPSLPCLPRLRLPVRVGVNYLFNIGGPVVARY